MSEERSISAEQVGAFSGFHIWFCCSNLFMKCHQIILATPIKENSVRGDLMILQTPKTVFLFQEV